jgi:predicted acyl esterase
VQGKSGVEKSMLSGYQTFGGLDPAEWAARGYAVVNVDPRGVFDSEGDLR